MNAVAELRALHFRVRVGLATWQDYVAWATERLANDEEGDDLDVVLLSGARKDEAEPLVVQIVERYLGPTALSSHVAAGKFIVYLHDAFLSGSETAISLEPKLWQLFYSFGQPRWLSMLARNCEYATDIPDFQKPFEDEFQYIADIWRNTETEFEFQATYDARLSRLHDLPALIKNVGEP